MYMKRGKLERKWYPSKKVHGLNVLSTSDRELQKAKFLRCKICLLPGLQSGIPDQGAKGPQLYFFLQISSFKCCHHSKPQLNILMWVVQYENNETFSSNLSEPSPTEPPYHQQNFCDTLTCLCPFSPTFITWKFQLILRGNGNISNMKGHVGYHFISASRMPYLHISSYLTPCPI